MASQAVNLHRGWVLIWETLLLVVWIGGLGIELLVLVDC